MMEEQTFGTQVQIRSAAYPAFTAILFHVNPEHPLEVGRAVAAGERLGRHIGPQTASDVALHVIRNAGGTFPHARFSGIIIPASAGMTDAAEAAGNEIESPAVGMNTPGGSRLVSYFQALTDSLWTARYATRGVSARDALILLRALRDANPLTCDSMGNFAGTDALPLFVELNREWLAPHPRRRPV